MSDKFHNQIEMYTFNGTGIALVTPFKEDGQIDYPSLEKLVNHAIEGGIDYLVCLGTTGETPTLTHQEKADVVQSIQSANSGRLPLVLGIGGNDTQAVKEEFHQWDLSKFEAVLSSSPAYNKPTQEGIYQHYKLLAQQTEANIILYNVPGRTSSNINSETTLRLAHDFANIVAIKEASPNFLQSTEILKDKPQDFIVLSGDDEFGLPMTLAGGKGVVSVIAQALPKAYSNMIKLALERKVNEAYAIHYQLMEIIREIYVEGNPAGIKSLLSHLGLCEIYTRLPLVHATDALSTKLKSLLEKLPK